MAQINANDIANKLKDVASFLLICGGMPTVDSLGATLALSLALQANGKTTQVLTRSPIRAEHSRIVGVDRVQPEITSQQNYVISLPNAVDAIEKVSCYAEGNKLNVVLQPYADVKDFDMSNMQVAKTGGSIDAILLIDVPNMQEINSLLGDQSNLLQQVAVYAIGKQGDNRLQNRLVDSQQSATSQIMLALIEAMHLPLNADIAGNLLQGIYAATNDFHAPTITPSVFEDCAKLLQKIHQDVGRPQSPVAPPPPRPAAPQPGMMPPAPRPPMPAAPRPPMPMPAMQPQTVQPPMPQQAFRQANNPQPMRQVMREFEREDALEYSPYTDSGFVPEPADDPPARPPMPQNQNQGGNQNRQQNQGQNQNRRDRNRDQNRDQYQQNREGGQRNQQNQQQGQQNQGGNQQNQSRQQNQSGDNQNEPEDWLAPKIYKTEDLL